MSARPLALLLALAAAPAGCGDEADRAPFGAIQAPGAGGAGGAGAAGSGGAAGQSGRGGSSGAGPGPTAWMSCQDSDEAFVRRAFVAVVGHRPSGRDEVALFVDLLRIASLAPADPLAGRRALVRVLADRGGASDYAARWADTLADFLRVQRVDEVANPKCFGSSPATDPTVPARLVRDTPPFPPPDGPASFSIADVILGSLRIDDLSPAYVANVLGMVAKSFVGANADPTALELARRSSVGGWFDAAYLHRDAVCLGCHNAEFSTTYRADPATNRHFPVPGDMERALFGDPAGPAAEGAVDGVTRLHAPFRYAGFAATSQTVPAADAVFPWGWAPFCGSFARPEKVSADVAPVDAALGAVSGVSATAWDVVAALQRGFSKLRAHGLSRGPDGRATDADEALSYLVSMNIAEQVWRETTGGRLTVAHGFPRNAAARDLLAALTDGFISAGFSLRALLTAVVTHPVFNQPAPSFGCGGGPAPFPPVLDPWTVTDADPTRQGNGVGDRVAPLSPRALLHAARFALGWGEDPAAAPLSFPSDAHPDESALLVDIGAFQKNAEPGFVGFDFQATLAWELRFGSCEKPASLSGQGDAVDRIAARALASPGATLGDAVSMLKDRVLGSASIDPLNERSLLSALAEAQLTSPAASLTGAKLTSALRLVCGALLAAPQFRLSGIEPGPGPAPTLAPLDGEAYPDLCRALDGALLGDGRMARCTGGALSIAPSP